MRNANTRYPRAIKHSLSRDLELYPVVALMGARQVGKSTLCRELAEEKGFAYCTLDSRDLLEHAIEDPEGLLQDLGADGAFIDEVQRAPGLFLAIKEIVDQDQRPGRYLLSGSNQPRVSGSIGDSLLGRAAYRTLRPLTLSELRFSESHAGWSFLFSHSDQEVIHELERRRDSSGELHWREVVKTGGFPRAVAAPVEQRMRTLSDYITVFSTRDIREVIGIESVDRFEAFLRLASARTGQELNSSGFSQDLGVSVSTIRRWTDALARSYMIEMIPPYSRNASQRVIKSPKIFMVDSALAMAAARETEPTGFHLENLVATDLSVWKDAAPTRSLHHWRLQSGQEVDFVLEEDGKLLPVEIKSTDSATSSDARHLRQFRNTYGSAQRGVLLSSNPEIRILNEGIIAAPWWSVL